MLTTIIGISMDYLHTGFQQIEKLVKLGYWEWHPHSNVLNLSEGFRSLLGIQNPMNKPGQFIQFIRQYNDLEQIRHLIEMIKKVKKGVEHTTHVFSISTSPSETKHFEVNTIMDLQKNSICISGTIQDVTERIKYNILKEKEAKFERKIAEIAARFVSEDDFRNAVTTTLAEIGELCEAGIVALYRIDNNTVTMEFVWNSPVSLIKEIESVKIPPSESNYLIELIKEQKVAYFHSLDDFPEIASKTKSYLNHHHCSSLLISGIQTNKQTVGALVVLRFIKGIKWDFSDIHMVKMASIILSNSVRQKIIFKQLRQSENRLQFALMAGSLGTWELDLFKQRFYYDERYANIFGYSNTTLNRIPEWFKNNIHPDDFINYFKILDECLDGSKKYYALEYRVKCKDGKYKWISDWSIVTFTDKVGKPMKMVGIIQDISRKKESEEELIKAKEKAEENEKLKTAFLANMSHEIRTPMNGITGFAELLYNNMVSDNEKHKYLEIIWKSSNRLLSLINNILDISKLETKQLNLFYREFSLSEIFNDIEHHFSTQINENRNIIFTINRITDSLANYISTDESRLKQVLINLISNSFKFCEKGFIETGYKITEDFELEFYVKDSGPGIPDEYQIHLFERFSQSDKTTYLNKGGAGLGFPIAKGIIELMGGKIWVRSVKNIGTTFYFKIPYQPTRMNVGNLI